MIVVHILELDFRLLMVRNNLVVCMFHMAHTLKLVLIVIMARILNLDFKLLKARNYLMGCSNLKARNSFMVTM